MNVRHLLAFLLIPTPVVAQKFASDASYSIRLTRNLNESSNYHGSPRLLNVSIATGPMYPVSHHLSLGAIATVGVWGQGYLTVGPRISLVLKPDVAINLTPSIFVAHTGDQQTARFLIDVSAMHQDRIGVTFQATSFRQYSFSSNPGSTVAKNTTAVYGGLRLGSKPGRYGILADAVAMVSAFIAVLIACSSGGCD